MPRRRRRRREERGESRRSYSESKQRYARYAEI
jgi:hypothetical protein